MRAIVAIIGLVASAHPISASDSPDPGYPLAVPPLAILDRLSELPLGSAPKLTKPERDFLAKCWLLEAQRSRASGVEIAPSLALEAMLFASGIEEGKERARYTGLFETLVERARKELGTAKSDRERGERLMQFLHKDVMKGGYEAEQTSFTAVFDTGRFNCVSSAALYDLVGTRLGLKLKAIAIAGNGYSPGHAALDLIDGADRVQVEPTNPDGFDWGAKVKRPGVIVIGLVPDRKNGREVDELGLASSIYSNRGVGLSKAKAPGRPESLRCYLAALALDPRDPSSTNNLIAAFVNWGPELQAERKFEEAIRVLGFGLTIDPKSSALRNNRNVAWSSYILDRLDSGDDKKALEVIRRAREGCPESSSFGDAAEWFCRHGQDRLKQGWEQGLQVVDRGLKVLPEAEKTRLLDWRTSVFRQWSQTLLGEKQDEGSLRVMIRAYAISRDPGTLAGVVFHGQEALRIASEKGGPAVVVEQYKKLREHFPEAEGLKNTAWSHAARAIEKLADAGQFRQAVAAVESYRPMLANDEKRAELGAIAFDRWAGRLVADDDRKGGFEKYLEGLKAFPRQPMLVNNAIATIVEWSGISMNKKEWNEAIRIYRLGLKSFPDDGTLLHNLNYCEEQGRKAAGS